MNVNRNVQKEIDYDRFNGVFLEKMKSIPKLNPIEEAKLIEKTISGDKEARKSLIESQLYLVVKLAEKYAGNGIDLFDLIQAGNIAVINFVDKLTTVLESIQVYRYLHSAIQREMLKLITSQTQTFCLSKKDKINDKKFNSIINSFEKEHGRKPTPTELSEKTKLSMEAVMLMLNNNIEKNISIEELVKTSYYTDLFFEWNKDQTFEKVSEIFLKESIQNIITSLLPREIKILTMRFGLDGTNEKTIEEVSKELNLSGTRICQLQTIALRKLRHPSRSSKVKDFML